MKLKNSYWWGVSGLILAVILTWAFWSEYGSGYSEELRKRWNGRLASYEKYDWNYSRDSDPMSNWRNSPIGKEAPKWEINIPESFGDVPMVGKSIPFLKDLAEKGNGDASLELAFRAEFNNTSDDSASFSFPSLDIVYQLETYLPMAEKQGRKGADFLCRLFEYRKKGGDDAGVKNVEGYQSFLSRMDEGDFALGKVYFYLDPNGEEALSRLTEGLRKKAACGDVSALRDFGYLTMLKHSRVGHEYLASELGYRQGKIGEWVMPKIQEVRKQFESYAPVSSPHLKKTEEAIGDWLKGFEWKRSLRKLEAPLEILREAADKGDLHAKYLWIQYAQTIKLSFSKGDWERHLKYVDDLIRGGGIYSEIFFNVSGESVIEILFYQRASFWRMMRDLNGRVHKEYASLFPESRGEILDMNVRASTGMADFARFVYDYKLSGENELGENRQEVIQLIKESAEQRDPFAMFYLSKIWCDYGEKEGDGLRAWELLKQFEEWKGNIHGRVAKENIYYMEREENSSWSWGLSNEQSVRFQEVSIVSRHGDMPGMTVKEAFEQFLEDSAKKWYVGKQEETLKAQFEKRGFKIPENKK